MQRSVRPDTVSELARTIDSASGGASQLADVVAGDPGLRARVVALANSTMFGNGRPVTEVAQAIALVGWTTVQTVAVAGALDVVSGKRALPAMQRHAVLVGTVARLLAEDVGVSRSEALAAGLLHDVGEILQWRQDPQTYARIYPTFRTPSDQIRAEIDAFGVDHATLARIQLERWRFPRAVTVAVGQHHVVTDRSASALELVVAAADDLASGVAYKRSRVQLLGLDADRIALLHDRAAVTATELGALLRA